MKLQDAIVNILAGSSFLALASTANAQTPSGGPAASSVGLEEIVVTARRKAESIEDVPTTVNAVSGEQLQNLNIRRFEDIATVVPGLSMANNGNGIGATSSVRGVNYDVNASGNNATVEFYLNDAPISAGNLFQAIYDIQQVELLRGPQGTLRGRASPSGSMTVITRRPDLSEIGGYVSGNFTNIGGYNGQGAVSFPIVNDKLAVRVAAVYDKNENTRVRSINNSTDPSSKTKSGRATILFTPVESLSFIFTAQKTNLDTITFDQVQSQQEINPSAPVINAVVVPLIVPASYVPPYITAGQRLSVLDAPRTFTNDFNNYNLQIQWSFLGQRLNYVGARNEQHFLSFEPQDIGDYFSPLANPVYQGFGQNTDSHAWSTAHELRLSNEERLFGTLDYILGGFTQVLNSPTNLTRSTPVFNPTTVPFTQIINVTPIGRTGGNKESSAFLNLTGHFGATEVSAGGRYINYNATGTLTVAGNRLTAADEDSNFHAWIWQGSVKYNFTEGMMAYASIGTSWRPGLSATGDFSLVRSPLEQSFVVLDPETSKSYEIGFKSTSFENRLRANFSLYHQKFTNYPYRSASGVFFVNRTFNPAATPPIGEAISQFNFVAAVPVEVNGAEAEVVFAPIPDWQMGLSAAIAKGEIKDGFIPCNDFNPHDGVPDTSTTPPASVAAFRAAAGLGPADTISGCTVTQRSSSAPQWSASLDSEYRLPITDTLNTFARGQLSLYGNSKNDPTNFVDDYDSYVLLNLFLGLRSANGAWEVSLYGKNVTNTERVLSRSSTTMTTPLNAGVQPTNYYGGSATTGLVMTIPREFGLNLRYSFGSR